MLEWGARRPGFVLGPGCTKHCIRMHQASTSCNRLQKDKAILLLLHLLLAVHRRLLLQMTLTNPDPDPKGGTALTRDDILELVKAVVEAVKA